MMGRVAGRRGKFSTNNNLRVRLAIILLTTALGVAALSQIGNPATTSAYDSAHPATITQAPPNGAYFDHTVIIVMEDHGINQICARSPPPCLSSNGAPYVAGLANNYSIGSQYLGVSHFSQADYIALLGGDIYGCVAFPCARSSHVNLVDRLETAGLTWKGYMENQMMQSGCDTTANGPYTPEHNPFVFFTDILNNPTRCTHIVQANPSNCTVTDCPLITDLNSSSPPNFMWLTPNDCNNMHGSTGICPTSISLGDNYLKSLVPNILSSTTFKTKRAALFVVFDEGEGFCPRNVLSKDCVYAVWAGSGVKTGFGSNNVYNHFSWTKTIETNWGLTALSNPDAAAKSMSEFFKADTSTKDFTITATSPAVRASVMANSNITIAPRNGFTGTVSLTDTSTSGLTCGPITPNSIPGGSGTAKVSCNSSVAGNYTLTIFGVNGNLTLFATATFRVQDFTVAATTPAAANVGISVPSTITVSALNGFGGMVSLTDIVPSGLTCGAVNPTSVTGSGSATVSCSSTVAGNYTLRVTGTSTPLVRNATALFQFRDFTIAATSPPTVNVGVSAASTVTIASLNRFAGIVNLTDTIPSGLTCGAIAPSGLTGSGNATVSCSASVAGNYTLTITGTSSLLVHSVTAIFRFQDFAIAATSPAAVDVTVSTTTTITVTALNHFAGVVSLSDTVPSGLTCGVITPTSITGSGTATISCSATIAGNYTLTISGTSGAISHSVTATFKFVDFTIAASSPGAVNAGASSTSTITITALNGFADAITLTDTVPNGLTCGAISPGSVTGSGTATVTCSAAVAGNYTLTITGTSAPLVHTTSITFMFRDFTIAASSPTPVDVTASVASTITINGLNHFSSVVALTDTVPIGLSCNAINPTNVTGSGTATVSCSANVAGNYTLTVTGTSGSLTHSTTITFRFQDFTIAATFPAHVSVGVSATSTITITGLNGFARSITLTDFIPSGLACGSINPSSVTGSGSATLSCTATSAGNYNVTITGTSTPLTHSVVTTFSFVDFTITATTPADFNSGDTGRSTVTVTPVNGFSGLVTLTTIVSPSTGLTARCPASLNVTIGPISGTCSPTSTNPGVYFVLITATGGGLSRTTGFVSHVGDFSISATSPSGNAGFLITSNVTLTSSENFAGSVALTRTVPAGLSCGGFSTTPVPLTANGTGTSKLSCTSPTPGTFSVTINAVGSPGTASHSTTVTFTFAPLDFSITASSPADFNRGATGNSTITITPIGNFAGTVTLTTTVSPSTGLATNCPATLVVTKGAATGTCSPSSLTPGVYMVNVTGTGGGHTHSAIFFSHVGEYSISTTSPTGAAGSSLNSTITLTSTQNFSGSITLTDTAPNGLSCGVFSVSPVSLGPNGTATSILSCSSTVAGTFTVTISGIGSPGNASHNSTAIFSFADFTITTTSPAPVNAGVFANSTITIGALNGFSGPVNLARTVPPGLTCGPVTPSSISGSGNAKVSCRSTFAGNYILTITGTSGSLNHNATVTFRFQDFTITSSLPAAANAGSSLSSTITITAVNGFSGTTTFSGTIPSGLACGAITPASVPGSGSATISCSAAAAGNYTLTITGTSTNLAHNATVTFRFQDFTITTTTAPATVNAGSPASATFTIGPLNGFAGTVVLKGAIPSGLSCGAITPSSITGGSGTATVSCSASLAGNYTLTMIGTSGSLTRSAAAVFRVQDFTIIASSPAPVNTGQSTSSTVTVTAVNGFNGTVTFSIAAPSGLVCGRITPANVTGSGSASLSCSAAVATNFNVTITGTSGTLNHSVVATFNFRDFGISASPTTVTVIAGTVAKSTVTVTRLNGFAGLVSLTTNSTSCTMTPTSLNGFGNSTLSCTFADSGIIPVTITGTNSNLSHSTTITVTVQDFTLTASPTSVVVKVGAAGTAAITVTALQGFSGLVNLATNSTACNVTPVSVSGSGSSTLSCTFASASTVHITVTGTSGSRNHIANVTYTVQDFTISASPTTVSLAIGQSGTSTLTISAVNGFTGTVALTSSVSPSGLNRDLNPASVALGGSQNSTLTVSTTASGTYTVTVMAKSGTLYHNVTLTILVSNRPLVSVVVGLDGSLYWNTFSATGSATGWQPLGGSTPSTPTLCQSGPGRLELVVRGMDNGIYHKSFSSGTWSSTWDSPSGTTQDQPACAVLDGTMYLVVRGLDNITYANSMSLATLTWSGWVSLNGFTSSPPVLVATSSAVRVDLLVRGQDNTIYHKTFVNGNWTPIWDSPGGTTPDIPAAVTEGRTIDIVVRGMDSGLWYNSYNFTSGSWSTWFSIGGRTATTPSLAIDSSGTLHLLVRGLDNGIWHTSRTAGGVWSLIWDSPGGTTSNRLAVTTIGTSVLVLATGMDTTVYFNVLAGTSWQTWTATGGKTADAPTLSNIT